jgi:hypothetical protein
MFESLCEFLIRLTGIVFYESVGVNDMDDIEHFKVWYMHEGREFCGYNVSKQEIFG